MLIPLPDLIARHGVDPTRVLHLGAHLGEEADAYDKAGAERVVWVEANPAKIAPLMENVAHRPGHEVIHAFLGEYDDEPATLHVANNGESSSVLDFGTHAREHRDVRFVSDVSGLTRSVDSICAELDFSPTFLNVDLQGIELPVLRGGICTIQSVGCDAVYAEVNRKPLYKGCTLIRDLDRWLSQQGFRRAETKWTRHFWGDALYTRKRTNR